MTDEEIKLQRLQGQHLLQKSDIQTVVRDLCGVQAQYLSHARHALAIRCDPSDPDDLVKGWTNRGTLHLYAEEDLPLFLHRGRRIDLRPVDTMESDAYIPSDRKAYFADLILDAIGSGTEERESLKQICEAAGMTDAEAESLFNAWGGLLRALCEEGKICHKAQEKKAFRLCPTFEPMEKDAAQTELLRRYFSHFGPATVKDASYFFGWPQCRIRQLLKSLPAEAFSLNGRTYYAIGTKITGAEMPRCLFLAGFDQLMLGYEKTESLFLHRDHIRDIFNLAGTVRPAVLVDGTVAGWWNLKNGKLSVTVFVESNRDSVSAAAETLWPDIKDIRFA